MSEKNSKYSVLMSVYAKEQADFLRQSIDSMISQTVPTDDFVIVCDGALTPELDTVIANFETTYPQLFQIVRLSQNNGLTVALDVGLAYCKNEFIARMDSDDISMPDRIERQLHLIQEKNADIVSGALMEFTCTPGDTGTVRKLPENHTEILKFARRRNPFNHPCVMFRKSAVIIAEGYMTGKQFPYCEDYYLWVRMLARGYTGYNTPEVLLHMRAGRELYQRRGGAARFKSILRLKWYMRKTGFSSLADFFLCLPAHFAVCFAPNSLRRIIYGKLLRGDS